MRGIRRCRRWPVDESRAGQAVGRRGDPRPPPRAAGLRSLFTRPAGMMKLEMRAGSPVRGLLQHAVNPRTAAHRLSRVRLHHARPQPARAPSRGPDCLQLRQPRQCEGRGVSAGVPRRRQLPRLRRGDRRSGGRRGRRRRAAAVSPRSDARGARRRQARAGREAGVPARWRTTRRCWRRATAPGAWCWSARTITTSRWRSRCGGCSPTARSARWCSRTS